MSGLAGVTTAPDAGVFCVVDPCMSGCVCDGSVEEGDEEAVVGFVFVLDAITFLLFCSGCAPLLLAFVAVCAWEATGTVDESVFWCCRDCLLSVSVTASSRVAAANLNAGFRWRSGVCGTGSVFSGCWGSSSAPASSVYPLFSKGGASTVPLTIRTASRRGVSVNGTLCGSQWFGIVAYTLSLVRRTNSCDGRRRCLYHVCISF